MVIIFGRLGQHVGVGVDVHLVDEIQLGGGIGRRSKGMLMNLSKTIL